MQSVQERTQLPPRPDVLVAEPVQVPPKRRRGWLIAACVAGFIALVGGAGAIAQQSQEQASTSTPVVAVPDAPPVEDVMSPQEAADAAVPLIREGIQELKMITPTSSMSRDAVHLNNIADLYDEVAALFEGVDETQVLHISSAADHYRAASDAASVGDVQGMIREVRAATNDVEAATAAGEEDYNL